METIAEKKRRAKRLTEELIQVFTEIRDYSAETYEECLDTWGGEIDAGFNPTAALVDLTHYAEDGRDGAEEALKQLKSIQANAVVWRDY